MHAQIQITSHFDQFRQLNLNYSSHNLDCIIWWFGSVAWGTKHFPRLYSKTARTKLSENLRRCRESRLDFPPFSRLFHARWKSAREEEGKFWEKISRRTRERRNNQKAIICKQAHYQSYNAPEDGSEGFRLRLNRFSLSLTRRVSCTFTPALCCNFNPPAKSSTWL